MVINRDMAGLDITCKSNWQEALTRSFDYLEASMDDIFGESVQSQVCKAAYGMSGYLKDINYIPRKIIRGKENAQ